MAGGVPSQLARGREEVAARLELLGWAGFGWLATVFILVGGYYALRFQLRRHAQSAFIAALCSGSLLFGAQVVGLFSHTVGVVLMLCDAAFGTLFLLVLVDELRRSGTRGGQGGRVDSPPDGPPPRD